MTTKKNTKQTTVRITRKAYRVLVARARKMKPKRTMPEMLDELLGV